MSADPAWGRGGGRGAPGWPIYTGGDGGGVGVGPGDSPPPAATHTLVDAVRRELVVCRVVVGVSLTVVEVSSVLEDRG